MVLRPPPRILSLVGFTIIIYHKDSGLWPSLEKKTYIFLLRLRKKAEDTARSPEARIKNQPLSMNPPWSCHPSLSLFLLPSRLPLPLRSACNISLPAVLAQAQLEIITERKL